MKDFLNSVRMPYQDAIVLEEFNETIIDDGIEDTEIDVVTTTVIEGIPNILSITVDLPEPGPPAKNTALNIPLS